MFNILILSTPPITSSNSFQQVLQKHDACRNLAMRRIILPPQFPQKIPSIRILNCRLGFPMAEQKTPNISLSGLDTKEKIEENVTDIEKKLPEPPEKPLPDDCCGSGCVRCVWDIYYDELEEYNKLVADTKEVPESKSN